MRRIHLLFLSLCLTGFAGLFAAGRPLAAVTAPSQSVDPVAVSPAIVIGLVGGYVKHTNAVHAEVQLAAHLREEYPAGVYVEAFENHRGAQALRKIRQLLDADRDGSLSTAEKQQARIILYGHSWGASEIVQVARSLDRDGIPVLLTIQVDSVEKRHQNDAVIPPNVAQAVNFYQPHGLIHGRRIIRAADPSRTRIIGNFQFDYRKRHVNCPHYPWWDRYFAWPHTEIECDPTVWNQVESYIRASLLPITPTPAAANVPEEKAPKQP
jgi:hypothetical protein